MYQTAENGDEAGDVSEDIGGGSCQAREIDLQIKAITIENLGIEKTRVRECEAAQVDCYRSRRRGQPNFERPVAVNLRGGLSRCMGGAVNSETARRTASKLYSRCLGRTDRSRDCRGSKNRSNLTSPPN